MILDIHPNPCDDYLEIQANNVIGTSLLYRMDGSLVRNEVVGYTNYRFDTYNLSPGVYILKVQMTNGNGATHRVLKQ